ncbi:MAG: phospholipase D-like domain-containing protein [Cyanobacteria bacterium J06560_6]
MPVSTTHTLPIRRRWIFLGACALLLVVGSSFRRLALSSATGPAPLVEPLAQDPHIQVYFNQSEASVYTEPYRKVERHGDNLEQVILDAIASATTSIDVAVQTLNLPLVAEALAEQANQGTQVRLILENQYSQADGEQAVALQQLSNSQVLRLDDTADGSKGSGLMHHKFVVIDSRVVVTGSANFTQSGIHGDADKPESRGNANVLLRIEDLAIAQKFTEEFNLMWGDGPGDRPDSQFGLQKPPRPAQPLTLPSGTLTLQFSPTSSTLPWEQSVNGLIARTLSQSTRSVELALFVFSEQAIANQLETQTTQGTQLRALIDPGFTYRSYSEALDMLGVALPNRHCKIETDNRLWRRPIESVGMPTLPEGDKLHHKFAVVDDTTVIVGSQNWSHAANTENDETLLVIRNPTVAAHFNREFERLYRAPELGKTDKLAWKIAEAKERCPGF